MPRLAGMHSYMYIHIQLFPFPLRLYLLASVCWNCHVNGLSSDIKLCPSRFFICALALTFGQNDFPFPGDHGRHGSWSCFRILLSPPFTTRLTLRPLSCLFIKNQSRENVWNFCQRAQRDLQYLLIIAFSTLFWSDKAFKFNKMASSVEICKDFLACYQFNIH